MTSPPLTRRQLGLLVGGAAVSSTIGVASAAARDSDTIVIATPFSARTLFPLVDQSGPTKAMAVNIFDKLVSFDIDYNVIPALAERWAYSDGRKTLTFHLRRGVTWHDGQPFTAADVKWFFDTIVMKREGAAKTAFAKIGAQPVETPDDHTAVFKAAMPGWDMTLFITLPFVGTIMPRHILEGVSEADLKSHAMNTRPIGTGPWKVDSYAPGETLTMRANDSYFRGRPKLDRMILRTIVQPQAAQLAYEAGEVDGLHEWYSNLGLASQLEHIKALPKTEVIGYSYYNLIRLMFNFRPEAVAKHSWLADINVRRAFAHAINKPALVGRAFRGAPVMPANGLFAETTTWAYNPNTRRYPYDPKLAASLFDAAGLKPDAAGIRLRLPLPYTNGEVPDVVIQVLTQMLRPVGIQLEPQPMEASAYASTYWLSPTGYKDVPLTVYSLTPGPTPMGLATIYESDYTPDKGGRNAVFYANPALDKLLEAAAVEADEKKQLQHYMDAQAVLMEDLPAIPLYLSYLAQVWNRDFGHDPLVSRPVHHINGFFQVWRNS